MNDRHALRRAAARRVAVLAVQAGAKGPRGRGSWQAAGRGGSRGSVSSARRPPAPPADGARSAGDGWLFLATGADDTEIHPPLPDPRPRPRLAAR